MAGVWDYGDVNDIEPLEDSSDEEENRTDSYDQIALLPANKRRKLQKLSRSQKDVELIDLDNEDRDGDNAGSHNTYSTSKQAGKQSKSAESDSDLEFEYRPPLKKQISNSMPLDPVIIQNQALLRSFKEAAQEPIMEEILPDPPLPNITRHSTAKPEPKPQTDDDEEDDDDGSLADDSQDSASSPEVADDGKVVLLLQSKEGKISLRISKQAALSKLFEPYKQQAIQKNWLPPVKASSVKFTFDGDTLSGTETAEGLDCEDNDIIEVNW